MPSFQRPQALFNYDLQSHTATPEMNVFMVMAPPRALDNGILMSMIALLLNFQMVMIYINNRHTECAWELEEYVGRLSSPGLPGGWAFLNAMIKDDIQGLHKNLLLIKTNKPLPCFFFRLKQFAPSHYVHTHCIDVWKLNCFVYFCTHVLLVSAFKQCCDRQQWECKHLNRLAISFALRQHHIFTLKVGET